MTSDRFTTEPEIELTSKTVEFSRIDPLTEENLISEITVAVPLRVLFAVVELTNRELLTNEPETFERSNLEASTKLEFSLLFELDELLKVELVIVAFSTDEFTTVELNI